MREIGGYNTFSNNYLIPKELPGFTYNLARNAMLHFASTMSPTRIYCPNFTCSSVKQALTSIDASICYYDLTSNYLPNISEIERIKWKNSAHRFLGVARYISFDGTPLFTDPSKSISKSQVNKAFARLEKCF